MKIMLIKLLNSFKKSGLGYEKEPSENWDFEEFTCLPAFQLKVIFYDDHFSLYFRVLCLESLVFCREYLPNKTHLVFICLSIRN